MDGDTASDTSLIEPADKKWLMELVEKRRLKREEDWGSENDVDELPREKYLFVTIKKLLWFLNFSGKVTILGKKELKMGG